MCLDTLFNKNKLDLNDVQALLEAMGHTLPEALDTLKREREVEAQKASAHEANAQQIEAEAEEEYQRAITAAKADRRNGLASARREEGLGLKAVKKARAAARLLAKLKS